MTVWIIKLLTGLENNKTCNRQLGKLTDCNVSHSGLIPTLQVHRPAFKTIKDLYKKGVKNQPLGRDSLVHSQNTK